MSDWSSDVCSSDLGVGGARKAATADSGGAFARGGDAAAGGNGGAGVVDGGAAVRDWHAVDGVHPPAGEGRRLRTRRDRGAQREGRKGPARSEEHTSELQSLMRRPYAVFGLKKKK